MVKKIVKNIFNFIFPITSVWIVVVYLRFLNHLHLNDKIGEPVILFLFGFVILFEIYASKIFAKKKTGTFWPQDISERIFLSSRIFLWAAVFVFWVVIMGSAQFDRPWMKLINYSPLTRGLMVYVAESYISIFLNLKVF